MVWRRDQIRENGWSIEKRADGEWLVRPSGPDGSGPRSSLAPD
jgi:hypothetical protein